MRRYVQIGVAPDRSDDFGAQGRPLISRHAKFKFRLYVAGSTPNSLQVLAHLTALCRAHLPDCHEIDILNVFREPKRVPAACVFMTPALVKLAPSPVRRIIGTLNQTQIVLQALRLETVAP